MKREVILQPDTLDTAEGFALLDDRDIALVCYRCRAPIEVFRLRGEPDGPVHLVRCSKNENHFCTSYHHGMDWDAFHADVKAREGQDPE